MTFPLIAAVYFMAGATAWWLRPASMMGALISLGGACLVVEGLANTEVPGVAVVGLLSATWILAVIVHLLLGFPNGRLRSPSSIVIAALAYFTSVVLQIPVNLVPDEAGGAVWNWVQSAFGVLTMLGLAWVLLGRLRRATPARRRTLIPLYGYGMAVAVLIPGASIILKRGLGMDALTVAGIQLGLILGVPIAFLAATMLGSFARTAEAEALAAWLSADTDRPAVEDALKRALGDPTVQLAYWVPTRDEFVDGAGTGLSVPEQPTAERAMEPVEVSGELVGAIVFDPRLATPRTVREAAATVALAVQGERLTADLRASQAALQRSRARLVQAGDAVRAAIARDLHDGLQVRLVLLGVQAQRMTAQTDIDELHASATSLRHNIDEAASELRRVAQQIMPSALEQRGLASALEDLTDRMPITTNYDMAGVPTDLPPAVELTAYFVVAEALTNATRHSGATRADVVVGQDDGSLVVEVSDDGTGGAQPRPGSGLAGLRDRVEAVGGKLDVISPVGVGTRMKAVLPCGS
ncbi:sensor histidine kinase [Tessaracoccus lubricantis]|uniref:sensor histidine kinase n=1 Tax=Tessaracoccus lubricantis TaxID=545543 RepID=UPI0031EC29C5